MARVAPTLLFAAAMIASVGSTSTLAQAPAGSVAAEANRTLVLNFYERIFNQHDMSAADLLADGYIQHNPRVPTGKAPFVSFFTGFFKENPKASSRIVRSAVDGDLVYLHVHSTTGASDLGRAIVDIFRVEGGKIVEHWDVVQPVPDQAANQNTMF